MGPDVEGDGTPNSCDNCPATSNFNQLDSDGDAIGNLCEGDADGDTFVGDVDNCPQVVNSGQDDTDGDGLGDACDPCPGSCPDGDGDGIPDNFDICANVFDPFQTNSDTDPLGDRCDAFCPGFATSWIVPSGDTDCDGHPDSVTAGTRGREDFIGTDLTDRCADTTTLNDEQGPAVGEPLSPWPPDINDNRATNLSDVVGFGPTFNKSGPNPPYNARFDLNAAPQPNGAVNLSDIVVIGSFFNRSCTP
jgi:hypothetical protein